MSTSLLTAWIRDWGDTLERQKPVPSTPPEPGLPRRSTVLADIGMSAGREPRIVELELQVNLLREERDLLRRLLDDTLARKSARRSLG